MATNESEGMESGTWKLKNFVTYQQMLVVILHEFTEHQEEYDKTAVNEIVDFIHGKLLLSQEKLKLPTV